MTIKFPGPVPEAAIRFLAAKRLRPSFSYLDVWRAEHAAAFTVAKGMQLDVLTSIKEELEKAIAEGRTLAQFQKDLTPTLQRLGWWGGQEMEDPLTGETKMVQLGSPRRLKTIYQANLRTARAAGQWERAERNKAALPYLRYGLGPSEEHRPLHVTWDGVTLPVDDPWWSTHMPPNGWGCKCRVRQISQVEMDRRGWRVSESPKVETVEWTNRRTGEVSRVPRGIDPGWDTNPGRSRRENMEKMLAGKLKSADPAVAAAAEIDLAAYRERNAF